MRSDTVANIHFVNLLFHHDYIVKVNNSNSGVCLKKNTEWKLRWSGGEFEGDEPGDIF